MHISAHVDHAKAAFFAAGDASWRGFSARSGSTATGSSTSITHQKELSPVYKSSSVDTRLVGLHSRKSPLTASTLDSPLLRRLRETAALMGPNAAEVPRCGAGGPTCFGNFPKPKPLVKELLEKAIPTELKPMRPPVTPAATSGIGGGSSGGASASAMPESTSEGTQGLATTTDGDARLLRHPRLVYLPGMEQPAGGVGIHNAATMGPVMEAQGEGNEDEEGPVPNSPLPSTEAAMALQQQAMQAEFAQLTERLKVEQQEQLALLQQQLEHQRLQQAQQQEEQRQQQAQIAALQEALVKQQLLLQRQQALPPLFAVVGGHEVRPDEQSIPPPGGSYFLHVKSEPTSGPAMQTAPRTPKVPGSAALCLPTPPSVTPLRGRRTTQYQPPPALPPIATSPSVALHHSGSASAEDSGAEPDGLSGLWHPLDSPSFTHGVPHSQALSHNVPHSAALSTGRYSSPRSRHPRGLPPMQDF